LAEFARKKHKYGAKPFPPCLQQVKRRLAKQLVAERNASFQLLLDSGHIAF
jgi:hypothetical protein